VGTFLTHFEVMDLDFFTRHDVIQYTDEVVRSQGIYHHRWGDAPLRYMTLALLARPEDVGVNGRDVSVSYCHGCH
jgi:hypothetical protein